MENYFIFVQFIMKKSKIMIVAVDGYSSTGKSTVSKIVAAKTGMTYIDTGAMYRVVALHALRRGLIADGQIDEEGVRSSLADLKIDFRYNGEHSLYETFLNGENVEEQIRSMEVSAQVSRIAALSFVRKFLVARQREMGKCESVIMDGRDIGSVVFPNADVKFFMTASLEVRARRRYLELTGKGLTVSYQEVEDNVRKRDYMDTHRETDPLVQTEDAVVVDNSDMTIEEEVAFMIRKIKEAASRSGGSCGYEG